MARTRKLGRATSHRTAMLRAMVTFLLENGKIETTVTRAKEVQSLTEKMITIAKENTLHNKSKTRRRCRNGYHRTHLSVRLTHIKKAHSVMPGGLFLCIDLWYNSKKFVW